MIAEPKAMSHGLTTGGGGGAFVTFMSAANPEAVEQPRASAVAHKSLFMDIPHFPYSDLPCAGPSELTVERVLRPLTGRRNHAQLRPETEDSGKLKKRILATLF